MNKNNKTIKYMQIINIYMKELAKINEWNILENNLMLVSICFVVLSNHFPKRKILFILVIHKLTNIVVKSWKKAYEATI